MSSDHYIPAAFIGRFSPDADKSKKARDLKVWAFHMGANNAVFCKASSLGYANDLYKVKYDNYLPDPFNRIESFDTWKYESDLNKVLDNMETLNPVSLSDWIHTAVPFVAGLFTRGIEFNQRHTPFLKNIFPENENTQSQEHIGFNINLMRHIRMKRLLPDILAAKWLIYHFPNASSISSNDLGLASMHDERMNLQGYAIPISPTTVIELLPSPKRRIAKFVDGGWIAEIEHVNYDSNEYRTLNDAIANAADRFIFGGSKEEVTRAGKLLKRKSHVELALIMESLWLDASQTHSVDHKLDWYITASIADGNIAPNEVANSSIDLNLIDNHLWTPMIFELSDIEEMRIHGIAVEDNGLYITLGKTRDGLL